MSTYELVTVIDANLSSAEIKKVNESVVSLLWSGIVETDDIGLMQLAYPLNGQDQAYYVSYHVNLETENLDELKMELRLIKGLAKLHLFSMKSNEKFFKLSELSKRFADMQPEPEAEEEQSEEESA